MHDTTQTQTVQSQEQARRRAVRDAATALDGAEIEREALRRRLAEADSLVKVAIGRYREAVAAEYAGLGCANGDIPTPKERGQWMLPGGAAMPADAAPTPAPAEPPAALPVPRAAKKPAPSTPTPAEAADMPPVPEGARLIADCVPVAPGCVGRLVMRADGDYELHTLPQFGNWDDPDVSVERMPDEDMIDAACAAASGTTLYGASFEDDDGQRLVFSLQCAPASHPEPWRSIRLWECPQYRRSGIDTIGDAAAYLEFGKRLADLPGVGQKGEPAAIDHLRSLWSRTKQGVKGEWPVWMPAAVMKPEKLSKKPRATKAKPAADPPAKRPACCTTCGTCHEVLGGCCQRCAGARALGRTPMHVQDIGDLDAHAWERTDGSVVLRAKEWVGVEAEDALAAVASVRFRRPLRFAVVAELEGEQTHGVVIELEPVAEAAAAQATTGSLFHEPVANTPYKERM